MAGSSRFSTQKRVALKGSTRKAFDTSRAGEFVSHAPDEEPITVSVVLAPKTPIDPNVRVTREEFAERHGAAVARDIAEQRYTRPVKA